MRLVRLREISRAKGPHPMVPVRLATAHAAGLVSVTTFQAFEALEPTAGQTVLVDGVGGVGCVVTHLARAAPAIVVATGLPADTKFLTNLVATMIPVTSPFS